MTLRQLRKKHNMTQVACAKYLGIPLRTYQNYERDDANPNTIKYQFLMEKLEKYGFIKYAHWSLSIEEIKNVCEPIRSKYKVQCCYLFGSYAKRKATEISDVDLLVCTEVTGIQFYELIEALRENLKKKVDLLNQEQIRDNFDLINEILKDVIKIYG